MAHDLIPIVQRPSLPRVDVRYRHRAHRYPIRPQRRSRRGRGSAGGLLDSGRRCGCRVRLRWHGLFLLGQQLGRDEEGESERNTRVSFKCHRSGSEDGHPQRQPQPRQHRPPVAWLLAPCEPPHLDLRVRQLGHRHRYQIHHLRFQAPIDVGNIPSPASCSGRRDYRAEAMRYTGSRNAICT